MICLCSPKPSFLLTAAQTTENTNHSFHSSFVRLKNNLPRVSLDLGATENDCFNPLGSCARTVQTKAVFYFLQASPAALAKCVLAEVPNQVVEYYSHKAICPMPPVPSCDSPTSLANTPTESLPAVGTTA